MVQRCYRARGVGYASGNILFSLP